MHILPNLCKPMQGGNYGATSFQLIFLTLSILSTPGVGNSFHINTEYTALSVIIGL